MKTFPLFIKPLGKKAVVIGGGKIALRRVSILLQFGFEITVIAPEIAPEIAEMQGKIKIIQAEFQPSYINDAFILVAATNNRRVNHLIYETAKQKNILISVADCEAECSFYFPAIAQTEEIIVGISGTGANHSAVKATAETIRKVINHEQNN